MLFNDPVASSENTEGKKGKLFLCGNSFKCSEPVQSLQGDSEKPLTFNKRCADSEQP